MDKQAAALELQHPNIRIIEGPPDSAEGAETLACYQTRVGRLPAVQGQALAAQLLGALAYAHEQGVVHGAIDPDHLLVSRNGQLKLTGFASASVLPDRGKSSRYRAPEQVAGQPAEVRSDLYAAAVVIYELLTGRSPFERDELRDRHKTPRPVRTARAELPAALDDVFRRALARDPADRYGRAAELSVALQSASGAPLWERPAEPATVPAPASSVAGAVTTSEGARPERRHSPEIAVAPSGAVALPALPGARASAVELAVAAACLAAIAWTASVFARPPLPPRPAPFMAQAVSAQPQADPREDDAVRGVVVAPTMSMSMSLAPAPGAPASVGVEIPVEPMPHPRQADPQQAPPVQMDDEMPSAADHAMSSRGSRLKSRPASESPSRDAPVRVARRAAPARSSLDCGQDLRIARDMCMAFRCATAEFRSHPVCVRMHAEQQRQRDVLAGTYGAP